MKPNKNPFFSCSDDDFLAWSVDLVQISVQKLPALTMILSIAHLITSLGKHHPMSEAAMEVLTQLIPQLKDEGIIRPSLLSKLSKGEFPEGIFEIMGGETNGRHQ
jgi:hypothetical protein